MNAKDQEKAKKLLHRIEQHLQVFIRTTSEEQRESLFDRFIFFRLKEFITTEPDLQLRVACARLIRTYTAECYSVGEELADFFQSTPFAVTINQMLLEQQRVDTPLEALSEPVIETAETNDPEDRDAIDFDPPDDAFEYLPRALSSRRDRKMTDGIDRPGRDKGGREKTLSYWHSQSHELHKAGIRRQRRKAGTLKAGERGL